MNSPVSSASHRLLLEKFLKAVRQKSRQYYGDDNNQQLNAEIMENIEHFPKLLNDVITQLQKEKIQLSQARMIAATACELLELYTLNHVYQPGEEENLKRVIKLLGFLILGAIKTPLTEDKNIQKSSQNLVPELPVIEVENVERYSVLALKVVNQIFGQKNLDTEVMLILASFYCVEWSQIQTQSFPRLQRLLVTLNFLESSPDYRKAINLFKKIGLREMIGLAEFQYRKQNYIQMKSKLGDSSLEDQTILASPLELLKESLDAFYQKLSQNVKNATASMMFMGESKIDFDSDFKTYWNYDRLSIGIAEKSVLIFRALVNISCDGIFWNERVRTTVKNSVGFSAKSQNLFNKTRQNWIQELNHLINLTITAQNVTTAQGGHLKKNILDWPLSSFFIENQAEHTRISQTVIKDKLEPLPILETANLLILLHSNIKETTNPLGQVLSLCAALTEKLSTYKKVREWITDYLEQQGFTAAEIIEILESRQD